MAGWLPWVKEEEENNPAWMFEQMDARVREEALKEVEEGSREAVYNVSINKDMTAALQGRQLPL